MTLAETQKNFTAAIFDADLPPPLLVERGRENARRAERFNIYRNNVIVNLIDVLEARYPAISRLTGSEFFRAMARAYVHEERPSQPLLAFGETFPEFLARFGPAQDIPYAPDIARIEWAVYVAFTAPDANAITAAEFAAQQPGLDATLQFHPAIRVISSAYPIYTIWRANADEDETAPRTLPSQGEAVLVTRPHDEPLVRRIARDAAAFIAFAIGGATITQAYETTFVSFPDFSLETALRDLLVSGALTGTCSAKDNAP